MTYPVMIVAFWSLFGIMWAVIIADIIDIWINRPPVIYDTTYGCWRSARLVQREQHRSH